MYIESSSKNGKKEALKVLIKVPRHSLTWKFKERKFKKKKQVSLLT
jgi:hypothetical protein